MGTNYKIIQLKDRSLLVVVLTTGTTSLYWKDLQDDILRMKYSSRDIYFDYLYRNGFSNRLFRSKIDENSIIKAELKKVDLTPMIERTTDFFFSRHLNLLDGAALSSPQRSQYINRLLTL